MSRLLLLIVLSLLFPSQLLAEDTKELPTRKLVLHWQRTLPPFQAWDEFETAKWQWVAKWVEKELLPIGEQKRPLIQGCIPGAKGNLVNLPTLYGCYSFALEADRESDVRGGEVYWRMPSERSIVNHDFDVVRQLIEKPLSEFATGPRARRFRGQTLAFSTTVTHKMVYQLDDAQLFVPGKDWIRREEFKRPIRVSGYTEDAFYSNRMNAVDPLSGKLFGVLSGYRTHPSDFEDSHYLSAPAWNGAELFFLNEKGNQLRLISLASEGITTRDPDRHVNWKTELLTTKTPFAFDFDRRIHAAEPVLAGGLVFCPTNLGIVYAVDQRTGKLVWQHRYAREDARRFADFDTTWVVSAALFDGDRIVYAPPDADQLFCFALGSEKVLWKRDRGEGLYVNALWGDSVVVVEEKHIRGISLKDGKENWSNRLPGWPTGRGALSNHRYYLPVKDNTPDSPTVILVYDMKSGKPIEKLTTDSKHPFANLLIHRERLISQSIEHAAVYRLP